MNINHQAEDRTGYPLRRQERTAILVPWQRRRPPISAVNAGATGGTLPGCGRTTPWSGAPALPPQRRNRRDGWRAARCRGDDRSPRFGADRRGRRFRQVCRSWTGSRRRIRTGFPGPHKRGSGHQKVHCFSSLRSGGFPRRCTCPAKVASQVKLRAELLGIRADPAAVETSFDAIAARSRKAGAG